MASRGSGPGRGRRGRSASGRRRGSLASSNPLASSLANTLASTMGSLVRSTLEQVGVVKDAVERQARSSRLRLDEAVLQRRRRDALARLGELVYGLAVQGKLAELEDEIPELAELLADIEEADEQMAGTAEPGGDDDRYHGDDYEAVSSADWKPPAPSRTQRDPDELRVWRPVVPRDDDHRDGPRPAGEARGDGDREPGGEPGGESQAGHAVRPASPSRAVRGGRGALRSRTARGERGGGIAFVADNVADDDDDLAEYMNDDDVPGKS